MSRKQATPQQPATRLQPSQPSQPARPTAATPTFAGMPTAGQPTRPTTPPSDDEIRHRAYQKWESAGRPEGDGVGFWLEAEQELARSPR